MSEYNLERFKKMQSLNFQIALREIRAGKKRTHWIWYIFPQLKGFGNSENSQFYGIDGIGEARAYIADELLRDNLLTITRALLELESSDAYEVMNGRTDKQKLCSCMTLFEAAAPDIPEFSMVLEKFYKGRRDNATLSILKKAES